MSTLVLQAQQGSIGAFEQLTRKWQGVVCAVALGVLRDLQASEEVAQEVFLAVWQKLATLQNVDSFGPWIRQMTRNKALAYRRAAMRRTSRVIADSDAVDRAGDDVDPVLAAEERRIVQEALDALPDDARDVMILFYREGRSIKQVARLLELSEAAVKKRLSRARQSIREDVLGRLQGVLVRTAPGAAFTAAVVVSISPAPAAAATVAASTGAAGLWTALSVGAGTLAAILLGYAVAERVVPASRKPLVRRARNLSAVGIVGAVVIGAFGPIAMIAGVVFLVVMLGYVQFRVLPAAFAPTDDSPNPEALRGARLGAIVGSIGWGLGALCGLAGAIYGAFG